MILSECGGQEVFRCGVAVRKLGNYLSGLKKEGEAMTGGAENSCSILHVLVQEIQRARDG